jgi:hypothetical protein
MRIRSSLTGISVALATLVAAGTAEARCTRLGFSVNDYGKEGPTKDAKSMLDKYIAKWATDNGIKKYTTGKKDVSCELYLDVIVFDEYTCRAEASVCWEGGPAAAPAVNTSVGGAAKSAAPKPAVKAAPKAAAAVKATGTEPPVAPKAKAVE